MLRSHETAELRQVGAQRQLVDRLQAIVLAQQRLGLGGQALEVLMARGHADVVEAVVGAERVRRVELVAAHAACLSVVQHEPFLRLR